jgi:serine/threonine protein kinase/TolB-like protein/Tfp pilus assembly protein PilF
MTPARWEKIKELVEAGLEREGAVRTRFLDEACADDFTMRAEVGELIAALEEAGDFLLPPAQYSAGQLIAGVGDVSLVGQRIGPYRTVRELGHGGMGTVYFAVRDDDAYRKDVAIKVVRMGMDTEAIVRAFRTERQILATLDHANIARLLDGGTTDDGRPYFVMDYVEGLPLDEYCDTHRLSIPERLTLFMTVCAAVHYAHLHGVVHRDLKPANILVSPNGVPKLLDFGIAKVLNPDESSVTTGILSAARPLTPAYASPEQIRGEQITPASDVYSLGVMLYELLTGHRPYAVEGHPRQQVERIICERQPEKPSTVISHSEEPLDGDDSGRTAVTPASVSEARADQPDKLRQRLAGDLDNVVLMALRKEAGRRYASVEQLSQDLRRHLQGLPVLARTPTVGYRTAKFVGRNRARVATAALGFAVMLILLDMVGIRTIASRRQTLAVLPFEPLATDARDEPLEIGLTDALITKLGNIPQLKIPPTQEVLKYRGAAQDPRLVGRELGVDTLLVGNMQRAGDRFRLSLRLVGTKDEGVRWAQSFDGPWTDIFGVEDAVAAHVADALKLPLTGAERERVTRRETENAAAYQEYLLGRHYWAQFTSSQLQRALEHFQRAVELDPGYALAWAGIADSYTSFAVYRILPPTEAYSRARPAAEKAIALDPNLSEPHSALGLVSLYYDWDWPAAERHFTHAIRLDPTNAEAHSRYSIALMWFARFDESLREIERARELDPLSVRISQNVGAALYWARRYNEAIQELGRALALDPNFFQTHQALGWAYVQTGAYEQAIGEFKKALDLGGGSQVDTDLAHAYAVSGHTAEANALLRQILDNAGRRYVASVDVAVVYAGLGNHDQAFAWLERAYVERSRPILNLKVNPRLDGLRSDPRFASLIQRVKAFAPPQ